jgi:hypothetical protein
MFQTKVHDLSDIYILGYVTNILYSGPVFRKLTMFVLFVLGLCKVRVMVARKENTIRLTFGANLECHGREADHIPPSSTEVGYEHEEYLIKNKENFNLTYKITCLVSTLKLSIFFNNRNRKK